MKDMDFYCDMDLVRYNTGETIANIDLHQKLIAAIGPEQTIEYQCPFAHFFLNRDIATAHVQITVRYKTLWFRRRSSSDDFTWTVATKHWDEGTHINTYE